MNVKVEDLSVGYSKNKIVLKGLNFNLVPGLTGLIGLNGSGKSTLLKTLCGILQPISGEIYLNDKNISTLKHNEIAKLASIVLTEKVQVPYMTVSELVNTGRSPHTNWAGQLNSTDFEIAEQYINLCGLNKIKGKNINEISDGEKQRCMIARTLAQETQIILLDEPTSYLDYKSKMEIMKLMKQISEEQQKIFLLSSHDLDLVFKMTNNCLLITDNRELIADSSEKILTNEELKQFLSTNKSQENIQPKKYFFKSHS